MLEIPPPHTHLPDDPQEDQAAHWPHMCREPKLALSESYSLGLLLMAKVEEMKTCFLAA